MLEALQNVSMPNKTALFLPTSRHNTSNVIIFQEQKYSVCLHMMVKFLQFLYWAAQPSLKYSIFYSDPKWLFFFEFHAPFQYHGSNLWKGNINWPVMQYITTCYEVAHQWMHSTISVCPVVALSISLDVKGIFFTEVRQAY